MKDIMCKLMDSLLNKKEITLKPNEIKLIVELVEKLENEICDYKTALEPNSYEDGNN